MTEQHECVWRLCKKWSGGIVAQCHDVNCIETLGIMEVNRRLNEYETLKKATDALSVEHARYFAKETGMLALRKYLNDYANILEGK